jgi:hypothetical protein
MGDDPRSKLGRALRLAGFLNTFLGMLSMATAMSEFGDAFYRFLLGLLMLTEGSFSIYVGQSAIGSGSVSVKVWAKCCCCFFFNASFAFCPLSSSPVLVSPSPESH